MVHCVLEILVCVLNGLNCQLPLWLVFVVDLVVVGGLCSCSCSLGCYVVVMIKCCGARQKIEVWTPDRLGIPGYVKTQQGRFKSVKNGNRAPVLYISPPH